MTRTQAIEAMTKAFMASAPWLLEYHARALAQEAVCALGASLHLEQEIAEISAHLVRAPYSSMM